MPSEVELKLGIAPEDAARLLKHRVLRSQATGKPRKLAVLNLYYDTPNLRLYKHHVALRLRRVNKRWVRTIKAEGRVFGGLHERQEWEEETIEGDLRLEALPDKDLQQLFDAKLRSALQPVFRTEFTRIQIQLAWANGDAVELALDRGNIRCEDRAEILCELELELKSGAPSRLFALARTLQRSVPLHLSNVSKAEQGYRLVSGAALRPHKPDPARPKKKSAAGEVCLEVLESGLRHLQANEEGVRLSQVPEFVHQTRIASRRLRSALKAFVPLFDSASVERFQDELRWLGNALNSARNWDVFIAESLPAICATLPDEPGLNWLAARVDAERDTQRERARKALESARYQSLVLEMGAWLAAPRWGDAALAGTPAEEFGVAVLSKRHRKLKKSGRDFAHLDVGERHGVRIAAKKLRYAAEFFAPLFPAKRGRKYLEALERLQDVLGDLNDEATTALLMQQLSSTDQTAAEQRACGLVLGWAAGLARERLPDAKNAWRVFAECKPFWPYQSKQLRGEH